MSGVDVIAEREAWARQKGVYRPRKSAYLRWLFYRVRRGAGLSLSFPGVIFTIIRKAFSILIIFIPVIFKKFGDDPLTVFGFSAPWLNEVWLSIGIAAVFIYNRLYDAYKDAKSERDNIDHHERKLALWLVHATESLRIGGGIDVPTLQHQALNCVIEQIQLILNNFDGGYLEATLLLFGENQRGETDVIVARRAGGARGVGRRKPAKEVMAFFVARTGQSRNLHDFNADHPFPKHGVSDVPPTYRSILFSPLVAQTSTGEAVCRGIVTIDSTNPYEFRGGLGERIVVRIGQYLNILRCTLADERGVRIDLGG